MNKPGKLPFKQRLKHFAADVIICGTAVPHFILQSGADVLVGLEAHLVCNKILKSPDSVEDFKTERRRKTDARQEAITSVVKKQRKEYKRIKTLAEQRMEKAFTNTNPLKQTA